MKNNRSAQSTVRFSAFFWTLSLITVGSMALGAFLAGPTAIGPAALVGGALLWIAVLLQEFRPTHGFAYRASQQCSQAVESLETLPRRAPLRRVCARRQRLAKAGC